MAHRRCIKTVLHLTCAVCFLLAVKAGLFFSNKWKRKNSPRREDGLNLSPTSSSLYVSYPGFDKTIYPVERTCKNGYFKLSSMRKCHIWLNCDEILKMKDRKRKIGGGVGKLVTILYIFIIIGVRLI